MITTKVHDGVFQAPRGPFNLGEALRLFRGWAIRDGRAVELGCPGCGEQYGHSEVLRLPMAERRIAA
ncbi:hypothetical protein [Streptomyces sp. NPDC048411]|uniref:hypothetical protein n=1 Tax=Streptomyces sp. NPDC048411 TaxID=3157206 RepID=UPI003453206E